MRLLNIGCGNNYHKDWINLDLYKSKFIKYYNIKNKLPFPPNYIDVIYNSHVIEHLDKPLAKKFIIDCYRVLKTGGIIRIVAPDLEQICREYLSNLRKGFKSNNPKIILNYKWNKLELFDQIVRQKRGGEMLVTIKNGEFNKDYILSRNGEEIIPLLNLKINNNKFFRKKDYFKNSIISFLKKTNPQKSGESHKWMYDKLDLKILLQDVGFKKFKIMSFKKSKILNWDKYALDKAQDGDYPRKPDSIYIEAIK